MKNQGLWDSNCFSFALPFVCRTSSRSNYGNLLVGCLFLFAVLGMTAPGAMSQMTEQSGVPSGLTATPSSVAFGNVTVGSTNTQTIQLKNTGSTLITIASKSITGAGLSITGLTTPLTLGSGKTSTFNIAFAPKSAGAVSGSASLTYGTKTLKINVTGTGTSSTRSLSDSPTSLSFGNVTVGASSSLNVTLTNTGNSSVTISSVTASGSGVTASGVANNTVLNAGQKATLTVKFAPTKAGAVSGSATVTSNASGSPMTISVSGTGVTSSSYSVSLNWDASTTSGVNFYNVYRATQSGGPYSKVAQVPGLYWTDINVKANLEYYYVVTALASNGQESGYSSQISALIP